MSPLLRIWGVLGIYGDWVFGYVNVAFFVAEAVSEDLPQQRRR